MSALMKLVPIDPPGTFCLHEAVMDMIKPLQPGSFIEVGCGAGGLSQKLCERGMQGIGYDFSEQAVALAKKRLQPLIQSGQYQLKCQNFIEDDAVDAQVDLALSMMVIEHIKDDERFIRQLAGRVRTGGAVVLSVPGRRDCWSIEDETVGHLRRYDKQDLVEVMTAAGLQDVEVRSVGVPTANLLFHVSNFLIARSQAEMQKKGLSQREQTETSGIREIPFKTVFPACFQLILNRTTLYPLLAIQRLFYQSELGTMMLGIGYVR